MSKKGIALVLRGHIRTMIIEDGAEPPTGSKSEAAFHDGLLEAFMDGKICITWDPEESCLKYRALQCEEKQK